MVTGSNPVKAVWSCSSVGRVCIQMNPVIVVSNSKIIGSYILTLYVLNETSNMHPINSVGRVTAF